MNGAGYIIKFLINQGASFFTFPGGCIAPLYDALQKEGMSPLVARHEQGAGYAALAKSRISHRPQVVMVTSGPGVTNVLTTIADAYYDSTPLIVITGQVGTADITSPRPVRQCGFQQVDTPALVKTITKSCYQPLKVEDIPSMLHAAFNDTITGRPGPVVLDLPTDVQRAQFVDPPEISPLEQPKTVVPSFEKELDLIIKALEEAKRPLVLAGQGVLLSGATAQVRTFVEAHDIPVVSTLLGLGAVDGASSLHLGFAGHTGLQLPGRALQEADCVLVLGARLDVRQTGTCTEDYCRAAKTIIHVDIDKNELLFPRVNTSIKVCADIKYFLERLDGQVTTDHEMQTQRRAWLRDLRSSEEACKPTKDLDPAQVINQVDALTRNENLVVTTGVGSHQHWVARNFKFNFPKRILLTSGGHGTMGYDLPSAIGAALTESVQKVLCFAGDASFQLNIQELQTVVEHSLPIKIFVIDNNRMALVSQFQNITWKSDPTTGHVANPAFAKIAKAYGLAAMEIHSLADLKSDEAIQLIASSSPALFHCHIDHHADLSPMLLANDKLDAMSL